MWAGGPACARGASPVPVHPRRERRRTRRERRRRTILHRAESNRPSFGSGRQPASPAAGRLPDAGRPAAGSVDRLPVRPPAGGSGIDPRPREKVVGPIHPCTPRARNSTTFPCTTTCCTTNGSDYTSFLAACNQHLLREIEARHQLVLGDLETADRTPPPSPPPQRERGGA